MEAFLVKKKLYTLHASKRYTIKESRNLQEYFYTLISSEW